MSRQWEEAYKVERNKLIDGDQYYSRSYDKYVLTLSGGALALSMTFVHDIIGDDPVRVPTLIVLAWISFTVSVAATLISIQRSAPLYRKFREILDREAQHAGENFPWDKVHAEQLKCRNLKLMDGLNNWSLRLFLSGVILLLSFIAFNLEGAPSMADETQPQSKDVNEDIKPAAAPVDGDPSIDALRYIHAGEKPTPVPIFDTPKPKPAEPVKPPPAPSEPDPNPPPDGDD